MMMMMTAATTTTMKMNVLQLGKLLMYLNTTKCTRFSPIEEWHDQIMVHLPSLLR